MNVCCFFGHRDTPQEIQQELAEQIENLIRDGNVGEFLVGHQGNFDFMVIHALRELKEKYPHINYSICLAYLPQEKEEWSPFSPDETVFLDGMETVPKKYAISRRNDLMLKLSDVVICYAYHHLGGAGNFVDKAIRQKKKVINLAKR